MADLLIRRALLSDSKHLERLVQAHAQYERVASYATAAKILEVLSTPSTPLSIWVAERQHRVIGYASATVDFSTWAMARYLHLDCLFVDEEYRGQHIGGKLLDAVATYALARGIREIQWQTPDWNSGAIQFYKTLGAKGTSKMRFIFNAAGRVTR